MSIKSLIVAIGASCAMMPAAAFAQQEIIAQQDIFAQTRKLSPEPTVNVSFGALMMQVPVSLATQLCPGTDAEDLAARFRDSGDVACTIPHEAYTSHSSASEPAQR